MQIAEELASLGAQSNAFTGQEYTGYWAKAESNKISKILEIVSDLYLNPIFNPEEIEKERGVIIQEINMYEDNPMSKVQNVFMSLLYGDQPAGWDIAGKKENVKSFKQEDFITYRSKHYIPQGTLVVVSGKFNEKLTIEQIKKYFEKIPRRQSIAKLKTIENQKSKRLAISFKESEQSHLIIGFKAFDIFDRRKYALEILSDALGGGMSSRLFKRVREELGAAYYIRSEADLSIDHGFLSISSGVDHQKIDLVVSAILEECSDLKNNLLSEKEFQKTKDHMIGNLILGLETSDELAGYYGSQEIMMKSIISPKELIKKINNVTREEVRSVAREIFKDNMINFAVVGPYKDKNKFKKILSIKK
jgi:predicted Zn-dependent peptidase